MDNALVIPGTEGAVQKYDADAFAKVSKSGDFLPRLQLTSSNSEIVKKDLIGQGRYCLVDGDNITNLEKQVDIVPVAWRPKAMRIPGDGTVASYFDPNSVEFQKVQAESNTPNSGAMYGPEFLIWVPSEKKYATFYMGSKSSRRVSKTVLGLIGKACTMRVTLAESGKFSWHAPVPGPCSTPITDLPDAEVTQKELERFQNPKDTQLEKAEEAPAGDSGRER